jgi:hypothetical protein
MTRRESPRRKEARALLLRHGYAVGGHVTAAKPKRAGTAAGSAPSARADKPRRSAGGRNRGTKIIIVNGHPQPVPVPRPVPVPMRPAPAPMAPMRPPLAPPTPPLRPSPPLAAKRGGRIAEPAMTAGAKSAPGRLQKLRHLAEP